MGSDDEFGPDTRAIRAWLDKRATYAADRAELRPAVMAAPEGPPAEPRVEPVRPRFPDAHDTGRAVVDLLGPIAVEEEPADVVPVTAPEPVATPDPLPAAQPTTVAVAPATPDPEVAADDLPPAVIAFRPRNRLRHAVSLVLLAALACAGVAGTWAGTHPSPGTIGLAAVFALLVLVVWAVRASAAPTRLTIRRHQLEVLRSGRRTLIDLASPYTPVAVLGHPGRRGWQVLVEQLDAPVLTITAADVEPEPFMEVLLRLRPELRGVVGQDA